MGLASRRPRTVLGCLVACHGPVRPSGLGAGWLPGAWWGGGLPGCGPGVPRRGCPGSRLGWPCRLRWGGVVPCRAAPGPVTEPASPGHQRCRVVAGRLGVVLPQRAEPVLGPPPGGVGRVGDDHVQAGVGGHLDQPVTEPGGGDARDGAAEPASPGAARGPVPVPLASLGPGPGEVQVLDHDRPGAMLFRGGDEGADRGPQPPVTGSGGQPGQVERDGGRGGVPRTLPSAARTATARCATLTSTATTGCWRSSSSGAAGAGAAFQDASMYQRPRTGSQAMS